MSSHRQGWKQMLKEAMTAASELINEDNRQGFLVIGGAALVKYGSDRETRDIDIAVTTQTLGAFYERAQQDSRFRKLPDEQWVYTCQGQDIKGLQVPFEFLEIGGNFVPKLHGMTKFSAVRVASLPDIAVMKARTYQDRGEDRDLEDLVYALRKMASEGQTFVQYKIRKGDVMAVQSVVLNDADGDYEALLSQIIG